MAQNADPRVGWECPDCGKAREMKFGFILDPGDCIWVFCPHCSKEYRFAVADDHTLYSLGETRPPKLVKL